jgi:hypothetical protein
MEGSFSIAVIISAVCGLSMVIGGILLLWRGAMSLDVASKSEALSLEWKRELRLTTQYPALAFFIIGLAFIVIPLVFSKPTPIPKAKIEGKAPGINKPLTLILETEPWISGKEHQDSIEEEIDLSTVRLRITLSAPLHRQVQRWVSLGELAEGTYDLGKVRLQRVVPALSKDDTDIVELPANIQVPPTNKAGGFGE